MARYLRQYRIRSLNYSAPPPESLVFTVFSILNLLFSSFDFISFFIKENIFIFSGTLSHNILDRIFVNTGSVVPQAPLSPRKVLYLIKRCYCFALSVYFFSSSFPLLPRKQIYFLSCFYRVRLV